MESFQKNKIGGLAAIYVGMTGTGKTCLVKHNIRNVHVDRLLVNDVQHEYYNDPDYEPPDIDTFMNEVHELRQGHAVFEEAEEFFSNRGRDKKMMKILIDKRHHENVIHLCFHGIADIPGNIYRKCNYVFVFQTGDTADVIEARYPRLLNAWKTVMATPEKAQRFLLPNGKYTPYEIVKILPTAKLI